MQKQDRKIEEKLRKVEIFMENIYRMIKNGDEQAYEILEKKRTGPTAEG